MNWQWERHPPRAQPQGGAPVPVHVPVLLIRQRTFRRRGEALQVRLTVCYLFMRSVLCRVCWWCNRRGRVWAFARRSRAVGGAAQWVDFDFARGSPLFLPWHRRHCKPESVPRGEPRACFHCTYTSYDPRNFRRHLRRHQTTVAPTALAIGTLTVGGDFQTSLPGAGCPPSPRHSADASGDQTTAPAPAPVTRILKDCENGGSNSSASKWATLRC